MIRFRQSLREAARRFAAWSDRPRWAPRPGPLRDRKVCLFATWSADGAVSAHAGRLAKAWHREGFVVVMMVASDARPHPDRGTAPDGVDAVAHRANIGYDFGSWGAAVRALPGLSEAALVAMTNDSVYGPLRSFPAMLARVDRSTADVVGLTESLQHVRHLQSYCVFYKPAALRSDAFARFWRRRFVGGRDEIIATAELALQSAMVDGGLAVEALFPAADDVDENPTLVRWRSLIDDGFPFVKVQLLRDNPFASDIGDWRAVLAAHGFDPRHVAEHLGARFARSAASR